MDDDNQCLFCGSTEFYVDEDGRTYCAQGHEQARGHVVDEDEADFANRGRVVRKKEVKEKQKFSRVLRGAKAYQLFLQCWQFILWKQCHTLVHQKGLPDELWTVVRELWTLWLSKLDRRLQDPMRSDTLTETEGENDPVTDDTDTEPDNSRGATDAQKRKTKVPSPLLIDTIALNYLGIIILQRPVSLATTLRWIQLEEITFIRAIRHVPQDMKDRLPSEYHLSLDTTRLLEVDGLQIAIYRRAEMFNSTFGMILPPLNVNLFLFSYVRLLALPIEVYGMARRLNLMTKYTFSYPDTTVSEKMRRHVTSYPEAQLISLLVVATKLLFPFDSATVKCYPKRPNDPTTLRMKWSAWLESKTHYEQALDEMQEPDGLKPGTEINVTDREVFSMTEKQLDQYMDWYQRTWIDNASSQSKSQGLGQESALDKDILDMFPLHDVPPVGTTTLEHDHHQRAQSHLETRIREVQASLQSRRAVSSEEETEYGLNLLRPGALYPRYLSIEEIDRAGEEVRAFHEEAAQVSCLNLKTLMRAVNSTEEKVDRWLREKRRRDIFGEESPNEDGDDQNLHEQENELPATSPPSKLAGEIEGLELGPSSALYQDREDVDMDIDMTLLPELDVDAGPSRY
ncbi:uncharacterized protein PV06_07042 [Exophiala oligosperma]|uniref:RRN7-type domain-containing protein n=1 Tax=Exophiala oligosperma TaxID=215243 RepID=A0A0D2ANH1_9EURO|nr:uncharacterized protein PV06_07042 [Exophiala oligosperma]KIW41491.1 hypothetical protein PV06_07042 [Exophiala oligosperma]